jgi:hypothetical protein
LELASLKLIGLMAKKRRNQAWNIQEKVVAIIEQYLDESAVVRQNYHLPVLGSQSGRTRQCDVVIWQGQEPRQTITIVEVQKRQSKPDITTFSGWLDKKTEVGAQHLICVSEIGFPGSIIEKAQNIGPSVRLMTLRNLKNDGWPFPSTMFNTEVYIVDCKTIEAYRIETHHLMKVMEAGKRKSKNPDKMLFKAVDSETVLNFQDVVEWELFSKPDKLINDIVKGSHKQVFMDFNWNDWTGLHHKDIGGRWVPIKSLVVRAGIEYKKVKVEWNLEEYCQIDFGDGIAWVVKGIGDIEGSKMTIVMPVKKMANARYMMIGDPHVIGNYNAFVEVNRIFLKARSSDRQPLQKPSSSL